MNGGAVQAKAGRGGLVVLTEGVTLPSIRTGRQHPRQAGVSRTQMMEALGKYIRNSTVT